MPLVFHLTAGIRGMKATCHAEHALPATCPFGRSSEDSSLAFKFVSGCLLGTQRWLERAGPRRWRGRGSEQQGQGGGWSQPRASGVQVGLGAGR